MTNLYKFYIDSNCGDLKLGPFRFHWYNKTISEEEPAFCILSLNNYNLEFGQIDQDRPGIYLTRYDYLDEPEQLRAILKV